MVMVIYGGAGDRSYVVVALRTTQRKSISMLRAMVIRMARTTKRGCGGDGREL